MRSAMLIASPRSVIACCLAHARDETSAAIVRNVAVFASSPASR
jgi:hypothetical protein